VSARREPIDERPSRPNFTMTVHYEDEPGFKARFLYNGSDPEDRPTLVLESDFHTSLFATFTEEQLRVLANAIGRFLSDNPQPEKEN